MISALLKRDIRIGGHTHSLSMPYEDTAKRHLSARKLSPEPSDTGTLILDFQCSEL